MSDYPHFTIGLKKDSNVMGGEILCCFSNPIHRILAFAAVNVQDCQDV